MTAPTVRAFALRIVETGAEDRAGLRRVVVEARARDGAAVRLAVRMDPAGEIVGRVVLADQALYSRAAGAARRWLPERLRAHARQLELLPDVDNESRCAVDARLPPQLRIPGT